jgi:hypothetical protein
MMRMIERYEKLADNYGKKIAQNGIVAIELLHSQ